MKAKKDWVDWFVGLTPEDHERLGDRHKKILRIFSKYKFEKILDVGCGDGNFSVLIGQACKAKEIFGIDISKKGVELARKNGVKAFQLDIDEEDFPFEDSYFDAVFAGEIIEHLFNPDRFLEEVYRVLKLNGIFVLSTPNLAWWINRIALLFGFQPYSMNTSLKAAIGHIYETRNVLLSSDHVKVFTVKSLRSILTLHSFRILKIYGVHTLISGPPIISYVINCIDKCFSIFSSLSNGVIVVSQKRSNRVKKLER